MPQDKFITRKQADLHELNPKYGPRETFTKDSLNASTAAYKKVRGESRSNISAATRAGADARALSSSNAVTARDAANAATARGRLTGTASAARASAVPQPRGGGILDKVGGRAAAMGPMAAVASAMYNADEATGFRRTKYSGNSGGPSFSMNPYASSNKSSYAGQSAMSKAMGVGKKK